MKMWHGMNEMLNKESAQGGKTRVAMVRAKDEGLASCGKSKKY